MTPPPHLLQPRPPEVAEVADAMAPLLVLVESGALYALLVLVIAAVAVVIVRDYLAAVERGRVERLRQQRREALERAVAEYHDRRRHRPRRSAR